MKKELTKKEIEQIINERRKRGLRSKSKKIEPFANNCNSSNIIGITVIILIFILISFLCFCGYKSSYFN